MKSYKEHLISTKSFGEESNKNFNKPVYRTSAIFPVIKRGSLQTKILFMGYWLVKRKISELGFVTSLRNENGQLLYRSNNQINSTRAFEIFITDLLEEAGWKEENFQGSIELEVFSVVDLVFPYPAFVLHYVSNSGSGLVHTTGRIYNDFEDLKANEAMVVKEAGFDVLPGKNISPFFSFVNGYFAFEKTNLEVEVIKENGENRKFIVDLGHLAPLQTKIVELKEYFDLDGFLGDRAGTVKIHHDLTGFFPRFIAGNFSKEINAVSITHTYYDNSENKTDTDYHSNLENSDELFDSSIFIPLFLKDDWYTELKLYPIYSPSNHVVNLKFFGMQGEFLGELCDFLPIKESQSKYLTIDFKKILNENGFNSSKVKGVQLYKEWEDKTKIPTRLKYGLNIGRKKSENDLPTNICFNSQLSNPKILNKTSAFKWMPLVNNGESLIVIQNSSFVKNYSTLADVELQFYSTTSDETIKRKYTISPNGQLRVSIDEELASFLKDKSGWVTVKSSNPFIYAWYFDFNRSGVMGGDHSF